ncbi:MAG TPA: WD40 repeat domain-containing protein, partial [Pirellulales bacterium]|nr:WD40 repeat domain-containing protein [Pirellulales bacterium]
MLCLLEMAAARSAGRRIALAAAMLASVFTFSCVPPVWSGEKPAGSAPGDCVDVKEPGKPLGRDAKALGNGLAAIAAMAVSPDGNQLAIAQEDRTALVCRADNGQIVHRFGAHQDAVAAVAFSPHGQRLATASFDGNVRIWRIDQPDSQPQILHGHDNWVLDVAFSPDGRWLASGGYDKSVRLWDAATGTLCSEFSGHTAGVRSVAFSPDGKLLASAGSDRTIKLWNLDDRNLDDRNLAGGNLAGRNLAGRNLAKRRELATLSGHEGAIRKLAFSPDGKTLASASEDTK